MSANPRVDVEQMLAHGRSLLAGFDRCYEDKAHEYSTEDLFGSLMSFLIMDGWTVDQLTMLAAAAVTERYRPPVELPVL